MGCSLTPRSWAGQPRPPAGHVGSLSTETGNTQVDQPEGSRWERRASLHSNSFETEMDRVPVLTGHSENSPAPAHTCRASCCAPTLRPTLRPTLLTSSWPKGAHIASLLSPMSLDTVQPFHAFKML